MYSIWDLWTKQPSRMQGQYFFRGQTRWTTIFSRVRKISKCFVSTGWAGPYISTSPETLMGGSWMSPLSARHCSFQRCAFKKCFCWAWSSLLLGEKLSETPGKLERKRRSVNGVHRGQSPHAPLTPWYHTWERALCLILLPPKTIFF